MHEFTMWTLLVLCSVIATHGVRGASDWRTTAMSEETSMAETLITASGEPCGGYLYGSSGTFYSPNYPYNYPAHADCTWFIRPGNRIIQLVFNDVNLEDHNCRFDVIYVFDGPSLQSLPLGTLCGRRNMIFNSTGSSLTVRFKSDSVIQLSGFRAEYRIVGSCRYNCGYSLGSCSCYSSCTYIGNCCPDYEEYCNPVTATSATAATEVSVQPSCRHNCGWYLGSCSCSSDCQYYGNCCYDYSSYCESSTTQPSTSDVTAQPSCHYNCGWDLGSCSCSSNCQYYGNCCHDYYSYCSVTTASPCGGNLFGSGTFTSPNHPNHYQDNSYCVWQLQTSNNQRIFLTFTYLQLEDCCSCDYIAVYNGPSVSSQYLGKVCGNNLTSLHSTSNYMTVVFRTDSSVIGRGFKAEFTSSLPQSSGRVDCSSDSMNIVIERSYLNSLGYNGQSLYLDDPSCKPQISTYQVVFRFPINACGNVRKFENGRAVYTNTVRAYSSSTGEITRQSHFKLNVGCQMEQDSVSQIMYLVEHRGNSSIIGTGRFNTSMAFYTSSSFYYQVTQVPYKVTLNQYLYVQVDLRRHDNALVVFLDTCVASPYAHDFHTRPYYLVRNGCARDNTYYNYVTGTQPYARFRFKAFQFLRATDSVYIQCKVLICQASEYNSRCRRGCNRRMTRNLGSEHDSQTLVLGPIQLKDPEKKEDETHKEDKA